jgi:hypothetical protein
MILKLLRGPLLELLQPLLQACFHFSYHPLHFMQFSTIALRKPGKGDYSAPAAWQPVVLLNTLGKVLETVVASRITALSKEHGLLSPQHMGDHPRKSTDTALDMLVKQIHAAWQADEGVASLLSLDITWAFNRVVPVQLLHNLRKSCIPPWILSVFSSFLSDKTTCLNFPGFSSPPFSTEQGVPQGSLLSPILFLFHNADLIDICKSPDHPATGIGFVDDANVLAFGKTTEVTCTVLKEIHKPCLKWEDMHGASFAPHKYVLVHYPKKKRNLPTTSLELPTFTLMLVFGPYSLL